MTAPDTRQDIGSYANPAGDPMTIEFRPTAAGAPINLTAYGTSWAAMLRQSLSDGSPKSFAIDATNAASGVLILSLTGTQTAAMNTDSDGTTNYNFDLQATGGAVTPQTPYKGRITIYGVNTHG
jgi:hypothetical protein